MDGICLRKVRVRCRFVVVIWCLGSGWLLCYWLICLVRGGG